MQIKRQSGAIRTGSNSSMLQNSYIRARDLRDLKLEISSEPPFTLPANWRIDELADGKNIPVVNPDVQLDAGYLNKLTEAVRGSLQLTLREGEAEIARESFEIRLLPPSQWSGTDAAPELLAAFVRQAAPAAFGRRPKCRLCESSARQFTSSISSSCVRSESRNGPDVPNPAYGTSNPTSRSPEPAATASIPVFVASLLRRDCACWPNAIVA